METYPDASGLTSLPRCDHFLCALLHSQTLIYDPELKPRTKLLQSCHGYSTDAKQNRLLAALPDAEWPRCLPQLEAVNMPRGKVLYDSGDTLSHVYFPTTAIVSLLYVMENGVSTEIAIVGNEGLVGTSLFMGGESTPSWAQVQSAGQGFMLNAESIKKEFKSAPVLHLLLLYTQALLTVLSH